MTLYEPITDRSQAQDQSQAQGRLALLLAPKDLRNIPACEQSFWEAVGFDGFAVVDPALTEYERWSVTRSAIHPLLALFLHVEYCCALGCVVLGFLGGLWMWIYFVLRPVWLLVTMRAELLLVSFGIANQCWRFPRGSKFVAADADLTEDSTLVDYRTKSASICCFNIYISKLTYLVLTCLTATLAPWQAALVLGNAFKTYYADPNLATAWQRGWSAIPVLGYVIGVIGFPIIFAATMFTGWVLSIKTARREHALGNSGLMNHRTSADCSNLSVLAQVSHESHASYKDGAPALDLLFRHQYFTKLLDEEGGEDLKNACVTTAVNDRSARFKSKSLFNAAAIYLKVGWVMLLLAVPGDHESALKETYTSIALTLFALMLHCEMQLKFVKGLRDLEKLRSASVPLNISSEQASQASPWVMRAYLWIRRWLQICDLDFGPTDLVFRAVLVMQTKQAIILSLVVLIVLVSVARLAGAILCQGVFGVTTGCVTFA